MKTLNITNHDTHKAIHDIYDSITCPTKEGSQEADIAAGIQALAMKWVSTALDELSGFVPEGTSYLKKVAESEGWFKNFLECVNTGQVKKAVENTAQWIKKEFDVWVEDLPTHLSMPSTLQNSIIRFHGKSQLLCSEYKPEVCFENCPHNKPHSVTAFCFNEHCGRPGIFTTDHAFCKKIEDEGGQKNG